MELACAVGEEDSNPNSDCSRDFCDIDFLPNDPWELGDIENMLSFDPPWALSEMDAFPNSGYSWEFGEMDNITNSGYACASGAVKDTLNSDHFSGFGEMFDDVDTIPISGHSSEAPAQTDFGSNSVELSTSFSCLQQGLEELSKRCLETGNRDLLKRALSLYAEAEVYQWRLSYISAQNEQPNCKMPRTRSTSMPTASQGTPRKSSTPKRSGSASLFGRFNLHPKRGRVV